MFCRVPLESRARPEAVPELLVRLRRMLPDTRSREACVSVSVARSQDDPNNFAFGEL